MNVNNVKTFTIVAIILSYLDNIQKRTFRICSITGYAQEVLRPLSDLN